MASVAVMMGGPKQSEEKLKLEKVQQLYELMLYTQLQYLTTPASLIGLACNILVRLSTGPNLLAQNFTKRTPGLNY